MKESVVIFEYKDLLESGVVLHILQSKGEKTERYKIDITYGTLKKLLQAAQQVAFRHPTLMKK